jgi:hypothetical protein
VTAVRRADGRTDAGDLVLGLQGAHAEALVLRQLVEDVRRGRDRVGPEEQGQLRQLAGGDQAPRQRGVAVDVGVGAGRQRGRVDLVGVVEELRGLTERVAGLERREVGVAHLRLGAEALLDPADRVGDRTGVHPRHETQREEVLRPLSIAGLDPERFDGALGEARHRHLEHREAVEAAVLERVGGVAGLGEVALLEGVDVDDHGAADLEPRQLVAQRRGVHGHQHVGRVARRGDLVIGDVHLEGADAGEGAGRRPDLGREVRQRGQVVAEHGTGAREAIAGELHAIARVACEADDDPVEPFGCGRGAGAFGGL